MLPAVVVREAEPPMPSTAPPVEEIAPVSEPFLIAPPVRLMVLMVWAKPPRLTVPPEATVVSELALKALAEPPVSVPPVTLVAPV